MKCTFCNKDEVDVRYMLSMNNSHICDSCVLSFAEKLNEYIKKGIEKEIDI